MLAEHRFDRRGWSWHGVDLPPWGTDLGGTFFAGPLLRSWWRAAYGLAEELEPEDFETRNLVCLSHGGNIGVMVDVLLRRHGTSGGLHRLVTVCTPQRRSMREHYATVSCPWLHVYSTNLWTNRMQWLGARGAGFKMPEPATNVRLPGIGHSDLLRDPERFDVEHEAVLMPFLRGT